MRGVVSAFFVFMLMGAAAAVAQETAATLAGTVADQSGAALAGGSVSITNTRTKVTRSVDADAAGRFAFEKLEPGPYTIEARAEAFAAASREIFLKPGAREEVALRLTLSPVSENVTVRAELESVPGGVAFVPETDIKETRAMVLKDVFAFVPGVVAESRYGTEESKFSIRGSGLRSNFHHRGTNFYINGMPYQEADGFSDYEALELGALRSVEVWKGANALRFGSNTMGGAVNFATETGETASPLAVRVDGGSYGYFKALVSAGGVRGPVSFFVAASDTELDGYREHSRQGRQRFYGVLDWTLDAATSLRFDLVYANIAEKLPGALTREELASDPRAADPSNVEGDWGRFLDFGRFGVVFKRRVADGHELTVMAYGQYRDMDHPIFQTLDQDVRNFGGEVRYRFNGTLGGRPDRFVVGFAPQFGNVGERRSENVGGRRGALTAVHGTRARNLGLFFENQLDLTSRLTVVLGGRADWAEREFVDEFLGDGDRSDERAYSAFSPKVGVVWRAAEGVQLFGNVSRSYEVPLLLELTSFGAAGFLDLAAQDTWQYEVGTRGALGARVNWEVSLFDAEIDDEIVNVNVRPFPGAPFTIPSYRNAPSTRHAGLEVGATGTLFENVTGHDDRLSVRTVYTWSRFRYVDDPEFGDNLLPGAARHVARAELRYGHPRGAWIAPNVEWSPATYFVDSANSVRNDSYATLNLKAGYDWERWGLYVEGTNLTDRVYSPSVVVDAANGRFFEPATGRSIYGGLRWHF
jgi:iron complex outermembrane recepter protein